jgi:hypothetical protein
MGRHKACPYTVGPVPGAGGGGREEDRRMEKRKHLTAKEAESAKENNGFTIEDLGFGNGELRLSIND